MTRIDFHRVNLLPNHSPQGIPLVSAINGACLGGGLEWDLPSQLAWPDQPLLCSTTAWAKVLGRFTLFTYLDLGSFPTIAAVTST